MPGRTEGSGASMLRSSAILSSWGDPAIPPELPSSVPSGVVPVGSAELRRDRSLGVALLFGVPPLASPPAWRTTPLPEAVLLPPCESSVPPASPEGCGESSVSPRTKDSFSALGEAPGRVPGSCLGFGDLGSGNVPGCSWEVVGTLGGG
jgi:hypothetical protein